MAANVVAQHSYPPLISLQPPLCLLTRVRLLATCRARSPDECPNQDWALWMNTLYRCVQNK